MVILPMTNLLLMDLDLMTIQIQSTDRIKTVLIMILHLEQLRMKLQQMRTKEEEIPNFMVIWPHIIWVNIIFSFFFHEPLVSILLYDSNI